MKRESYHFYCLKNVASNIKNCKMKGFRLILLILIFYSGLTFSQSNKQDTALLRYAIGQTSNSVIYYTNKSIGWEWIKEDIDNQSFKGITKETEQNSITLTIQELDYINQQIELNKEFIWCDSLLNNSKRIVQDSMWVILDEQKKLYREKIDNALLNKDTASLMKIHYEHPMIYGFSKPIYLRDNTICLLYFIALCGRTCGHDEISFYKMENNQWFKWIVIHSGCY